ncbi:hypothetical protein ES705_36362 [subsurface metagenome]
MARKFVNLKEASAIAGVSRFKVHYWVEVGLLPGYQREGYGGFLVRLRDLENLLEIRNKGEEKMVHTVTRRYELIDLECPACGTLFSVLADALEDADTITCPICRDKSKTSDYIEGEDQVEDEDQDEDQDDEDPDRD